MSSILKNYSAAIICAFGWILYLINDLIVKHLTLTFSSIQINFFNFTFGLVPFFIFLFYKCGFKNLRINNFKVQIISAILRLI